MKRRALTACAGLAALILAAGAPAPARQSRTAASGAPEALRALALAAAPAPLRIENRAGAPFTILAARLARIPVGDYERAGGELVSERQVLDGLVYLPVLEVRNEGAEPLRSVGIAIVDVEAVNTVVTARFDRPLAGGDTADVVARYPIVRPAGSEARFTTARVQWAWFERGRWDLDHRGVRKLSPRPKT